MIIIYLSRIARKDAVNNPSVTFIFGDNDTRTGYGGLAKELRNEPNAVGIRVKKKPTFESDAFYSDTELSANMSKIIDDINQVVDITIKAGESPHL